jgi:hypothetical protein
MISIIRGDEVEKWDGIVKSFKNYDVCYLNGYAKAFQINGDGEPLLFYYQGINTRAINVIMIRDIAISEAFNDVITIGTMFDVSTPYGYGGLWIEGSEYDEVNKAYDLFCREYGFISEFVRFHLYSNAQANYTGTTETRTHNVVRNLDLSIDEVFMDFEHKVRKNIKRAICSDLRVEIDNTGDRLEEFLRIYYLTMDRSNANENFYFTKEFFNQINKMMGNYMYIHVLHGEEIISSELILYGTENCYSFLGGTNKEYFNMRPNDLLKYEVIKWGKEKGLKRFILGGGYGEDDGIFRYKKSFAPNGIVDFYVGKKIINKDEYMKLINIKKKNVNVNDLNADLMDGFFPKYRDPSLLI